MLRQTTMFVHVGQMKELDAMGKARGVATAVLVRLAIGEYLRRERRKK